MSRSLNLKLDDHSITIESHITQPEFVYFAQENSTGYIKIGGTSNFKQRLSKLHADNALGVRAIATIPCACWQSGEKPPHELLEDYQVRGEWFNITPDHARAFARDFKVYWCTTQADFGFLFRRALKEEAFLKRAAEENKGIPESKAKAMLQSQTVTRLRQVTKEQLALYVSVFGSFECVDLPSELLSFLNISSNPFTYMDFRSLEVAPLAIAVLSEMKRSKRVGTMGDMMRALFYLNLHCSMHEFPDEDALREIVNGVMDGKIIYKTPEGEYFMASRNAA